MKVRSIIKATFFCFVLILIATTIPPNTLLANATSPNVNKTIDTFEQIFREISAIGVSFCGSTLLIYEAIKELRHGKPLDPYKLPISKIDTE